jgi:hypothetical protein
MAESADNSRWHPSGARAKCPECGERSVEQWQQVWVRWDVYVDDEHGILDEDIDHPEIEWELAQNTSFRCTSCHADPLSEEGILAAS